MGTHAKTKNFKNTTPKRKPTGLVVSSGRPKLKATSKKSSLRSTMKKKFEIRPLKGSSKNRKSNDVAKARRSKKIERRKREKKTYTAQDWAAPAPANLVAKLDVPKVKSKYQSYFEFADNPEKKEKKLEFKECLSCGIQSQGDPAFTNACKELSRENDAMIFIVSTCKEEQSKISEHVYRIGFHFRETIIENAREFLGEREHYNSCANNFIEPVPESQEEINKQADAAIRDLFPRIPNTDRRMVIEHAFKKGAMYQGEPTVGTQSNIPLSRRVQLAILAHIRHNHTRYDKLLRETSWMNARKAVEPICLDVILKWRGDEETGRDQLDEILREVVIISDSENEDEDEQDGDSSDDGEVVILPDSSELRSKTVSKIPRNIEPVCSAISDINSSSSQPQTTEKRARRGFKRYQAAWEEALHRQQEPHDLSHPRSIPEATLTRQFYPNTIDPYVRSFLPTHETAMFNPQNSKYYYHPRDCQQRSKDLTAPLDSYPTHHGRNYGSLTHNGEMTVIPDSERPIYYQFAPQRLGTRLFCNIEQQAPQVVVNHNHQDMVIESIETASHGAPSSLPEDRWLVFDRFNRTQSSHTQKMSLSGHQAPDNREVIIIDDDSPQAQRRRMMREDDLGHLRPLSSRDHDVFPTSHTYNYPMSSITSAKPRDFLSHSLKPLPQYAQGSSRDVYSVNTGSALVKRIPVSEAQGLRYFSPLPKFPRRAEAELRSGAQIEHIDLTSQESTPNSDDFRPRRGDEQYRTDITNLTMKVQGSFSSPLPSVPLQPSYVYDVEPTIYRSNYGSDRKPSQFPAERLVFRGKDSLETLSGRYLSNSVAQRQHQKYSDSPGFPALARTNEARSPQGYTERPMHVSERSREISYLDQPVDRYRDEPPIMYHSNPQFLQPSSERRRISEFR